MEITRTSLRSERQKKQQVPKQTAQGQTQQRGGYGEELKEQLQSIGNIRRDAPVIKAKRVESIISPTEQYTKDAVKTAMEKLKKFILGRGLGEDKPGDTEKTATFASTGGGGGKKDFFTGLTNDQLGLLSTDQLVARDIKRYGNTVPEGSFGSGSLKTIQDSPGSAVDTNIARHSVGTSEDQPATVLFQKEEVKAPMGTTFTGIGTAEFLKSFTEKPKPQTVAALPSDYKKTEQRAFDDAESYRKLVASGLDKTVSGKSSQANVGSGTKGSFGLGTHGQGAPSGTSLPAGSFGISDKGKAEAAKNKAEAQKKKAEQKSSVPAGSFGISDAGRKQAEANKAEKKKAEKKKATPAQKTAVKKATTVKKSNTSSSGISKSTSRGQGGRKSSTSKKSSSKKSGGSKSGGSKGGSKAKSSGSRGQGGGKASRAKGGSFGGKRRRANTKRSRRRCDIRCKFDISILTNQNLIRDDLADVAYFVRELKENKL